MTGSNVVQLSDYRKPTDDRFTDAQINAHINNLTEQAKADSFCPRVVTREGGIDGELNDEITLLHMAGGFNTRRAYFFWLSQQYNVNFDIIESAGHKFGTKEDFNKLVDYVTNLSPSRNRP